MVEHFLAKEDVEGSNPFSRSRRWPEREEPGRPSDQALAFAGGTVSRILDASPGRGYDQVPRARDAFARAGIPGPLTSARARRHTFVRLWEGDETAFVGILGWTSNRMLSRYRPYDVARAKDQHNAHAPARRVFAS